MPELPDIEAFTQYLRRHALGQEIADVCSNYKPLVRQMVFADFSGALRGQEFTHARRRGKCILVSVGDTVCTLVLHFGMTGRLEYGKQEEHIKQAHIVFRFCNGRELRYINPRKFGAVYLVSDPAEISLLAEMGPEPLELSEEEFLSLLAEHERKNIKSFFMDQYDIAGIGNVYSDEILFGSGIDPHRTIGDLEAGERRRLFAVMRQVLPAAVDVASSNDGAFPPEWLVAHRHDMQCPLHDHELTRETIAGRSAIYCNIAQQ